MAPPRSRSAASENLLLLVGSLLFAGALIALVEVGLRLTGLGAPDGRSRLAYQRIHLPILRAAVAGNGARVLGTADRRLPYQAIRAEKAADALRIFTFGGSATAGLGFSPNVTFARHLERMLRAAYPGRAVEVANLGIVALASKQVRTLVEDVCRNYQPDVVIVYSGNNEFLEIHAEKYAARNASWASKARTAFLKMHLVRAVKRLVPGASQGPTLAEQNLSREHLRMTQDAIIREIEVSEDEVRDVVDAYEANVAEMARAGSESSVHTILMTVASNWEWRGRKDLPEDWVDELLGSEGRETPGRYREAIAVLGDKLAASPPGERHEWLFRRATARAAIGEFDGARQDYRAAMNADPHLRRALDRMNERVERAARQRGVALLDTVEVLQATHPHGIVGFQHFYDYVHMTPEATVVVAAALLEKMREIGAIPAPTTGFDTKGYVAARLRELEELSHDPLAVAEWMGLGFDVQSIHDRDLWKYDRMVQALDERIERDPRDARALVYRGNARSFEVDGAQAAARDYRAALDAGGDEPAIRANLGRLQAEGRI